MGIEQSTLLGTPLNASQSSILFTNLQAAQSSTNGTLLTYNLPTPIVTSPIAPATSPSTSSLTQTTIMYTSLELYVLYYLNPTMYQTLTSAMYKNSTNSSDLTSFMQLLNSIISVNYANNFLTITFSPLSATNNNGDVISTDILFPNLSVEIPLHNINCQIIFPAGMSATGILINYNPSNIPVPNIIPSFSPLPSPSSVPIVGLVTPTNVPSITPNVSSPSPSSTSSSTSSNTTGYASCASSCCSCCILLIALIIVIRAV